MGRVIGDLYNDQKEASASLVLVTNDMNVNSQVFSAVTKLPSPLFRTERGKPEVQNR